MDLLNEQEFKEYVKSNYKLILTNDSSSIMQESHGKCNFCQKEAFLKIGSRYHDRTFRNESLPSFATFFIQCPSCKRQSFILTVVLEREDRSNDNIEFVYDHYKIYQLPTSENNYEVKDIPLEFNILRQTVLEAIRGLDFGLYTSSTIMFRRALQILAKDILGATGKTLFNQLDWLKSNQNKLQINLTALFHDNSNLIRLVGNQGAHPDNDEQLIDFSVEDANAVHDLFLLLVNEVFVIPKKLEAMKTELSERRKLK